MTLGLMQDGQLLISSVLEFAARAHGSQIITSQTASGSTTLYNNKEMAQRARRFAAALSALGMTLGDRISSLAWNTHQHLEIFYAVPSAGLILHAANPRFTDDQLIYTINHAESRVLIYDSSFIDIITRIRSRLRTVELYVGIGDGVPDEDIDFEDLARDTGIPFDWPALDEKAGSFLCYTSGTTGNPKGVLYSHRSVILHALSAGLPGAFGLGPFDTIMPCSPLFHATGWGLPFAAAINGCKLVMPGSRMDPENLANLISCEGVTISSGVPTIWTGYVSYIRSKSLGVSRLGRVICGGSAVPRALTESLKQYGVSIIQVWGMTEMSPLGVVATPTPAVTAKGSEYVLDTLALKQGRMLFGVELSLLDDINAPVPHDGDTSGRLHVKGPWVLERYYKDEITALNAQGWFDTGDIATIDEFGFLRITDRAKDVIKSGGEWISSIDIENAAMGCPGVKIAAVIGVPHPRWEERPIIIIEPTDEGAPSADIVSAFLAERFVRWWLPDRVLFSDIPLTSTGKIDKKLLRARFDTALLDN